MKKIFIMALLCAMETSLKAQNVFPLPSGNVGIGTVSPQGNLDIYDASNTATIPLFSIRSNFHVAGNYGMIRFGDYTQTTDYQKGAIIYESVSGAARGKFHIALENTDGSGSVSLSDAKFTVLSNGNVGIGITDPQEKLAVNGLIHAKAVIIDLLNWPDYVFRPTYRLRPLSEVKAYIDQNHRLPEMPSDKEVESKGLDVSEMNKLLTKKVEELTLYLIEKDKKEQEQAAAIATLQQQMTELLKAKK